MRRAVLIAFFLLAPLAIAKAPAPVNQPPCVAIDAMRMTHVVRVPTWPNFLGLRKAVDLKFGGKSIMEKLPGEKPKISADKSKATKQKAMRKKVAKVKGCKLGRTKNKHGQCGRWK